MTIQNSDCFSAQLQIALQSASRTDACHCVTTVHRAFNNTAFPQQLDPTLLNNAVGLLHSIIIFTPSYLESWTSQHSTSPPLCSCPSQTLNSILICASSQDHSKLRQLSYTIDEPLFQTCDPAQGSRAASSPWKRIASSLRTCLVDGPWAA